MLQKIDKQWIGLILGLIAPSITFFSIYLFAYHRGSFNTYYEMITAKKFLSQILSLSVLPNVGVFFIFIWLNKMNAAKGVLAATILVALAVFGIKIFS
jgi:hypothetical protein